MLLYKNLITFSCLPVKFSYKLVNNRTCEDINECEDPGACSQTCTNEIGTFKVRRNKTTNEQTKNSYT